MGIFSQQFCGAFQKFWQVDVHTLEFEPSGFYFRKIQNVIEDIQQRVCGILDGICKMPLPAVQVCISQ